MNDFILEIGCENLPPRAIQPAFEQLERDAAESLRTLRFPYAGTYATGSARRLVLLVRGLAPVQESGSETVTGPPVAKAFDGEGRPTPAAVGFARSQRVAVEDLERVTTERGEYLGLTRQLESRRAEAILEEVVPGWVRGLRFPKTMKWEADDIRFARPIRWVVCMLGRRVVPVSLAGLAGSDVTHKVPWVAGGGIRVRGADDYLKEIGRAGVVLDHGERRRLIEAAARKTARRLGFELVDDPELLDELTFMLEEPSALVGGFEEKYLRLPEEVVVTAMRSHQRYLALRDRSGHLQPRFVTFTEGPRGSPESVRRGNERVLRARLEDALFYWQEDLKAGLGELAGRLQSVVFIEGLGTLRDKAERVTALSLLANAGLGAGKVDETLVRRAALLAKADLASVMIKDGKEFTALQGLIGSHYARETGEAEDIVAALREQYLPRTAADPLPTGALGSLLSLSDRLDTVAGCFLAGLLPTGSQDPYALRRQANGLLRILEGRPSWKLDSLLEAALRGYIDRGLAPESARVKAWAELVEFFKTRIDAFLRERGHAYDVVAAVAAVAWSAPAEAARRAQAVAALRGEPAFESLITAVRRVGNILPRPLKVFGADWVELEEAVRGAGSGIAGARFDPARFEDPAEVALDEAVRAALPRMRRAEESGDPAAVLAELSRLGPAVDRYFERVLVNVPDESLRANRHAYLAFLFALFSRYADFSQIAEESSLAPR